jgi:DNA ligase 4
MSHAITLREEGFVVKPANAPYTGRHGWMKLKKDHIPGLGDNLDFCIVGAGFDAEYARDGGKPQQGQKWNTWHIGCLENKSQVLENVSQNAFIADNRTRDPTSQYYLR